MPLSCFFYNSKQGPRSSFKISGATLLAQPLHSPTTLSFCTPTASLRNLFGSQSDLFPAPSDLFGSQSDLFPAPSDLFGSPSDLYPAPSDLFGSRSDLFPAPSDLFGSRSDLFPAPSDLFGSRSDLFPAPRGKLPLGEGNWCSEREILQERVLKLILIKNKITSKLGNTKENVVNLNEVTNHQ